MPNSRSLVMAALVSIAGALVVASAAQAKADDRAIVFAAASMKTALDAVNHACAAEVGGEASISYASSSALAKQIENGAPADIFISADLAWMAYLRDRNLVKAGTVTELLGNSIVLVAPKDSAAEADIREGFDLAGLLGDGRLAIGEVTSVPAGKYGREALEKLGLWSSVADRLAQAENVRAALKFVATGEAPLGIVYASDAAAEPGVKVVGTFPEGSHQPIIYPIAQTSASSSPEAEVWLKCAASASATPFYEEQGFTVLGGEK